MAHDVFISYPGKDRTVADAVCAKLEENKIRCWIAPRDIPAGKNFAESIIDAIDISKVFVLIWSINTNSSEHILTEINQAFNQGIPIIPFRIQEVEPTSAMRYYFGRTHWLDALTPPLERHIDILAGSILAILDRTPEVIPDPVVVEIEPDHPKPPARKSEPGPLPEKDRWHDIKKTEPSKPAVKTKTKPPHTSSKKKQIIFPIAAAVLVVAAFALLLLTGVFEGLPLSEKTGTVPPTTAPVEATLTNQPISANITSTNTPIPSTSTPTAMPAWMEEVNVWANPILAAIKSQPPDFEDEFSVLDPDWNVFSDDRQCPAFDPAGKFIIVNGELQLVISPSCPFFAFTHPEIGGEIVNYVLQTDINFAESAISYEFIASSEQGMLVDFILSRENWALTIPDPEIEEGMQTIHEGVIPFDSSKPFTFTVIKNEETFLFYLDDILLLSYDPSISDGGNQRIDLAVNNWTDQPFVVESITLDNIRYWNINNLFIPGRILAQIENETPAFADDFSSVDNTWQVLENPSATYNPDDANLEITEGLLRLNFENTQGGILSHPEMQYSKYVLQVDVDFNDNPVGMEFRMWGPLDEQPNFGLGSDGHWNFEASAGGVVFNRSEGDIPIGKRPDFSEPVTITIINSSPHFFVYLNSSLLFSYSNQNGKGPFLLDFVIDSGKTITERRTVELDNFKIWDLAGQQ